MEKEDSISPLPPPGRKAGKWNLILPVATPFGHVLEGGFHPGRGGGGTRYIFGWGGAARPLIPQPCLRQKSLIFLPCL